MPELHIIFYEDRYGDPENDIFIDRITSQFPIAKLTKAGSLDYFRRKMKQIKYDLFILDIMGANEEGTDLITGLPIDQDEIGLTILKELRNMKYPLQNPNAPVIIRSAKGDEFRVKTLGNGYRVEMTLYPSYDNDTEILNFIGQLDQ